MPSITMRKEMLLGCEITRTNISGQKLIGKAGGDTSVRSSMTFPIFANPPLFFYPLPSPSAF